MNELEKIVKEYVEVIIEYKEFLKEFDNLITYDDMPFRQVKLLEFLNESFEEEKKFYKNIESTVDENIKEIFSKKDMENILPFLRYEDIISEKVADMASIDLTKHYFNNGYDIYDDNIQEEIIMKVSDLFNDNNLDSNIYSKNVLKLQPIANKLSKICKDLYYYCTTRENQEDIEI